MSRDDRLSKLFRDNQHKLEEYPSPAVWERIETRLDKHRSQSERRMRMLYRYAAVAAGIILIVATFGLSQLGEQAQDAAMAQEALPPVQTLEEALSEPVIAQLEEEEPERPTFSEKASAEKTTTAKTQPRAAAAPATSEAVEEAEEEEVAQLEKIKMQPRRPTLRNRANEELSLEQVRVNNRRYAKPPTANSIAPTVASSVVEEVNSEVVESISLSEQKVTAMPATASPRRSVRLRKSEDYAGNKDGFAQAMHRKLRKLDWLLGTWKGSEGLEGESYEEWSIESENQLQGRGYHVIDGDKIFSERMRIVYMPNLKRIYYVMQAEYGGEELAFPLVSATGNRIVFEQLDMPAEQPTRVTLERTQKGFRTIIENTNGELQSSQQSYLQNRNHLSRYQAKRYLQRYKE